MLETPKGRTVDRGKMVIIKGGSLMKRDNPKELCQRRAKQLKHDYPECSYCQRLDLVARDLGFESYQHLIKSEKPSHEAKD